jgi:hypothetical protein
MQSIIEGPNGLLDISNAFQNSVVFDPSECTYITLPQFYLTWFTSKWPDYKLPSTTPSLLVLQCLKSIQGTKDAGLRWYRLLSGHLREFCMTKSIYDHGIFSWMFNNKPTFLAETDNILVACDGNDPFLQIKSDLEKLFDVTCSIGNVLRFLNLRIVQSPHSVSMDLTQHIKTKVLHDYFRDTPSSSVSKKLFPFPVEDFFEKQLFEAAPLPTFDLHQHEKSIGILFNSTIGALMHITTISRPDLAYATMRLSGYMSCPNLLIFHALHHTMCYLYHHPHLPIMYPSKPSKSSDSALSTFWAKGHAEYLTSDYGDGLVTFIDADHARCLRSCRSVSVYFILYNGVAISWSCKKQLQTALHSTAAEITALFRGSFKTVLLHQLLQSIGLPPSTPTPTFADDQGTINLIRTNRLADTVCHHAVKISWLNEISTTIT